MLFLGRLMMAAPAMLLGVLVYLWSRQLFGVYGGLMSLTLYAFSPTMLANNFLATSDSFAAFFFTAAVWSVWALLHRITMFTLVATGLTISGLLLSKYSGVIIIPVSLILFGIRLLDTRPLLIRIGKPCEIHGRARQIPFVVAVMLVEAFTVFLVIWASYGFRYSAFAPGMVQSAHGLQRQEREATADACDVGWADRSAVEL
jgi:hypothetical protein